jgi:F0F1-type ATP synthase membrane subunit b/b'
MANTIVTTQIVVQFDDQFTDSANRAIENYKKSFEEAQKKAESLNQNLNRIYEKYFETLRKDINNLSALELTASIGSLTAILATLAVSTSGVLSGLASVGVATTGVYAIWMAGEELNEWRVGGQPIKEYVEGVQESLDQLSSSESIELPPVPPGTVQSLESAKTCLEQIQQMRDIFITVNLLDNATQQAKAMRDEIEEIFSQDITQRVTIAEETVRSEAPFFSSAFNSSKNGSNTLGSLFGDGLPGFQTPSLDLTGFGDSVGNFASGINRVPRDMIAMIHKNEAVLPSDQAEEFRRSNSSGMTIQNLNFSFNVPNGLKLDREEFRNLAFMMRDELKRLDRRVN